MDRLLVFGITFFLLMAGYALVYYVHHYCADDEDEGLEERVKKLEDNFESLKQQS